MLNNRDKYYVEFGSDFWQLYDRKSNIYGQSYKMNQLFFKQNHLQDALIIASLLHDKLDENREIPSFFDNTTKTYLKEFYASLKRNSPINLFRFAYILSHPLCKKKFKEKYMKYPKFREYILKTCKEVSKKKQLSYSEVVSIYCSVNYNN